ncbi:MAG: PIN domain-containing protein [Candidatus Aenigmarchaeota archaeon]|nr:PIN domain-containing protein [Candidatus Aenigmarchaeota archaeon]
MKYLDANIFLLPLLYQDKRSAAARSVLVRVATGEMSAATSLLTWDEVVRVVQKTLGKDVARAEGRKLLGFPHLRFLDLTTRIAWKAQELREQMDLGPRDALHAATALTADLPAIISTDTDFDGIPGLQRIGPERA